LGGVLDAEAEVVAERRDVGVQIRFGLLAPIYPGLR
jgi:hypothetical protein